MPTKKKTAVSKKAAVKAKPVSRPKKTVKAARKAVVSSRKALSAKSLSFSGGSTYTFYVDSSAFFPLNSSAGYIDFGQDGRCAAVAGESLTAPVVLPVGATLQSFSIHYLNTTPTTVNAIFLRKHMDRHSGTGEVEMSFISIPPGNMPPDNYLTVTDTSFSNAGVIQDRFTHFIEIPDTGNFGGGGKLTIRGISYTYSV